MDEILDTIGDSHCHIEVDSNIERIEKLAAIINSKFGGRDSFFHIMSTNHLDIDLVDMLLSKLANKSVIPYFGVHPWYSHLFTDLEFESTLSIEEIKLQHYNDVLDPAPPSELIKVLPRPISIKEHLNKIERLIEKHIRVGIGEIGLDKMFRVPSNGFHGNQEVPIDYDNKLSPCRVKVSHQRLIFEKQLELADKYKKQVSLHCVKAHGLLYEIVVQYKTVSSIILHSYSGSIEQAKEWIKCYKNVDQRLFFSFSSYINGEEKRKDIFTNVVENLNDDQILIETDFGFDKFLVSDKSNEYFEHLIEIFEKVCIIKKWDVETGKMMISNNLRKSIS